MPYNEPNISQKLYILNSATIGFEFEFLTDLQKEDLRSELTKVLDKIIIIPYTITGHNQHAIKAHNDFVPNKDVFKLEVDGSGGKKMVELVTGPLPYTEALLILNKFCDWLHFSNTSWSNRTCGIHINISLDTNKLKIPKFSNINLLKFAIGYNEDYIYSKFPERKNNVYTLSIKKIFVNNPFIYNNTKNDNDLTNYTYPNTKYYGVNFSKLNKNYIEFRYLGGDKYETKYEQIKDVADYSIFFIYDNLKSNIFTETELQDLNNIKEKANKISLALKDYDVFKNTYTLIKVTVDLKEDPILINTYWNDINKKLFDLIYKNELLQGEINYDSDLGTMQIYKGTFNSCHNLKEYELIKCQITGILHNCKLWDCEGQNLNFNSCYFIDGNDFKYGKIIDSHFLSKTNTFENFWINNGTLPIYGHMINCIVRNTGFYDYEKLDNEVIEPKDEYKF